MTPDQKGKSGEDISTLESKIAAIDLVSGYFDENKIKAIRGLMSSASEDILSDITLEGGWRDYVGLNPELSNIFNGKLPQDEASKQKILKILGIIFGPRFLSASSQDRDYVEKVNGFLNNRKYLVELIRSANIQGIHRYFVELRQRLLEGGEIGDNDIRGVIPSSTQGKNESKEEENNDLEDYSWAYW
ncbi:MAG: hypothetical protein ACK4FL_04205 [Microgenomates group bacterium]